MPTAIIGLAASGKTTIFNALTRGTVDKGIYGATKSVNIGVGEKPDLRLDRICHAFNPRRKVQAEMTFWDMPTDYATGAVMARETVNSLQKSKALLVVVRAFEDPAVPHPDGSVDWIRDLEKLTFEILFADIALIDRRIERIDDGIKAMKSAERVQAVANIEALKSIQSKLEQGQRLQTSQKTDAENRALSGTFMLSALPLVVAVNIGEDMIGADAQEFRSAAIDALPAGVIDDALQIVPICGSVEEELRTLDEAEASELRSDLAIAEDSTLVLMDACLSCLATNTYYTASEREVRAWHFPLGATAPEAAGIVHSDMERGFIRAEVVAFEDFARCGSMVEARKQGVLRQEGRNYVFNDGDIVNFLFSV